MTVACLAFRLGAVWYAVEAQRVVQVIPQGAAVPVPGTPPFVLGLISTGGRVVVLLDPGLLLGAPPSPQGALDAAPRDLVLSHQGLPFGVRVDEVSDLVHVPEGALHQTFHFEGRAVTVLEADALIALAQAQVEGK